MRSMGIIHHQQIGCWFCFQGVWDINLGLQSLFHKSFLIEILCCFFVYLVDVEAFCIHPGPDQQESFKVTNIFLKAELVQDPDTTPIAVAPSGPCRVNDLVAGGAKSWEVMTKLKSELGFLGASKC